MSIIGVPSLALLLALANIALCLSVAPPRHGAEQHDPPPAVPYTGQRHPAIASPQRGYPGQAD